MHNLQAWANDRSASVYQCCDAQLQTGTAFMRRWTGSEINGSTCHFYRCRLDEGQERQIAPSIKDRRARGSKGQGA